VFEEAANRDALASPLDFARTGADNFITPLAGGLQFFGDARPLPAAYQDIVLHKPLQLSDGLLEMLLLALLHVALVDENGLVDGIVNIR
jgi:hypothetical protein